MTGPRAAFYQGEAFKAFRAVLARFEPDRPERLTSSYFSALDPEQLLYEEIERLWASIDADDDWAPFHAKLSAIRAAGAAWDLGG